MCVCVCICFVVVVLLLLNFILLSLPNEVFCVCGWLKEILFPLFLFVAGKIFSSFFFFFRSFFSHIIPPLLWPFFPHNYLPSSFFMCDVIIDVITHFFCFVQCFLVMHYLFCLMNGCVDWCGCGCFLHCVCLFVCLFVFLTKQKIYTYWKKKC